ncbi:PSP1 C-terminal conserved region-domain-containing protein [Phycomyces nitens]|nr:PSP1 C-terminal conserved region-domain-containing protein [Phycomyces nitens]
MVLKHHSFVISVPEESNVAPHRRHSLGVSVPRSSITNLPTRYLDGSDFLTTDLLASVDAYFEPPVAHSSDNVYHSVEFKSGRSEIYYCSAKANIQVGDWVMVEADRGRDVGIVAASGIDEVQSEQENGNPGSPRQICRLASPAEVDMLTMKKEEEEKALAICQTKVRSKHLQMEIVDAEYQWDRRKLTFYFVANRRVDFRELVRDLFKMYKTRIWM